MTVRVLALVYTLKPTPAESSSDLIARQLLDLFAERGATGELVRVVDHDVRPGVAADMGDGDAWPEIRRKVANADILLIATPTWVGHMSSVAQRVLERLDAELSETDDEGRSSMVGEVAVAAVVGDEDGAHKITADLFQAFDDVGFTVPAQGGTYWNGEAMRGGDYLDLEETPTNATLVRNAVHLATLLRDHQYPAA